MNRMRTTGRWWVAGLLPLLCNPALPGVVTDGTVGAATSLAGPNYDIAASLGRQLGGNLFHSFTTFDIASGESATFSGPGTVQNIIGRVTGGSGSSIDGAINSTIDGANLYLINPRGIVFGPDASLNVSGSFHASTAGYLVLSDGTRFDATAPGNPVLTSAVPAAFGFLDNPASIRVTDTRLQVGGGRTLSLVGGDIITQNALLYAPGGTVQVAAVGAAGEVDTDVSTLDPAVYGTMGSVDVSHPGDPATRFVPGAGFVGDLDASGDDAGTVVIRGGEIQLDRALVFADSLAGHSGSVDIQASGRLHVVNGATVSADHLGSGAGGRVSVTAAEVSLENGGRLQADNYTAEPGGRIEVDAGVLLIGGKSDPSIPLVGDQQSGLFAAAFDRGRGGDVSVRAGRVSIGGGGVVELNAGSAGGSGGDLTVAAGQVDLHEGGAITVNTFGAGDAGTVTLQVDSLELTSGGAIATQSLGSGQAGAVDISATDHVTLSGSGPVDPSGIYSNAFSNGDGGRIAVSAPDITLTDGALIQSGVGQSRDVSGLAPATATTRAGSIELQAVRLNVSGLAQVSTQSDNAGQAGDISMNVSDTLQVSSPSGAVQSGFFSTASGAGGGGNISIHGGALVMDGGAVNVSSAGSGDAGTILATVGGVTLRAGAQLSTSVDGGGNGGALSVTAGGDVVLGGQGSDGFRSGIYSQTSGSGAGGAIEVAADHVLLSDHATINSESRGTGDAGNITVHAVRSVQLDNASINTAAASADGGNIQLTAAELVYLKDSEVTAAVGGGLGDGGNVGIDPQFVVLSRSNVLASAIGGNGGNITIVADHFISSYDSVLNASSQLGIDGTISIVSPDQQLDSSQAELPVAYLDAVSLLQERCGARHLGDRSSLVVAGRTALPMTPDSPYSLLSGPGDYGAGPNATAPNSLSRQWLSDTLAASRYGCNL